MNDFWNALLFCQTRECHVMSSSAFVCDATALIYRPISRKAWESFLNHPVPDSRRGGAAVAYFILGPGRHLGQTKYVETALDRLNETVGLQCMLHPDLRFAGLRALTRDPSSAPSGSLSLGNHNAPRSNCGSASRRWGTSGTDCQVKDLSAKWHVE